LVYALLSAEEREDFFHAAHEFLDADARLAQGSGDEVLLDRERRKDVPTFGDVADAESSDVVGGHVGDVPVLEVHRAASFVHQPRDGHEGAGLARAIGADEGDDFAPLHRERDAGQGGDMTILD
jgi:hypothetical protein